MDSLVKPGKGILYHLKKDYIFTREDLEEAIKVIFGYE